MKKRMKFLLFGISTIGLISIPTALALTSCSKKNSNISDSGKLSQVKYNVDFNESKISNQTQLNTINRPTVLPSYPSDENMSDNSIDPNFNQNAINEFLQLISAVVGQIINDAARKIIENDMNDVILDFLSVVENETGNIEIELAERDEVDKVIKVNGVTIDKNFLTSKKITTNITVTYKSSIDYRDNEKLQTKTFDYDLYVEFCGLKELIDIVLKIVENESNIPGTNNEVNYNDIKEIFLGDNFKDKTNGWTNSFKYSSTEGYDYEESTLQERGLINYVASFQASVSPQAKMLGYTFDIADFWNKLTSSFFSSKSTMLSYWAPSTQLNRIFVPNFNNNGYNFKINIRDFVKNDNWNSFIDSYTYWQRRVAEISASITSGDTTKIVDFYNEFKLSSNISLPDDVVNNLKWIEIDPSNELNSEHYYEVKFIDNFGNEYEFEIFETWWA